MQITHRRAIAVLALLLIGVVIVPRIIPSAMATGVLYISPANMSVLPVGGDFSISVRVANMDPFNGWDIQVQSDQSVINPTSVSVSGNILNVTGSVAVETVNCVNGVGRTCCLTNACYPLDGPGIAHSAFFDQYNATGGYGPLFNITFHVVSNKPYSPITIIHDTFSNGGQNGGVIHTKSDGYYGTAPDFSLASNPPELDVVVGSSNTSTIVITSLIGFTGKINLTTPPPGNGITVSLNASQILLAPNSAREVLATVQVRATTPASSYPVTVNAANSSISNPFSSISHQISIIVSVKPGPDFEVGASPADLLTHQSSSNSTTITVESLNHFSGTVYLQVTGPSSAPATLDNSSLKIPNGGTASTTLRITTESSPTRFSETFNIIATNGSLTHSVQVVAEPPPGDFQISTNPAYVSVVAGHSEAVTIGVTSMDYYVGTMYILGTSQSGVGLSFNPGNFYLNASQTVFTKLNITTDIATIAGNHTIELTVVGQFAQTTQHFMKLTLIVSTAPVQSASQPRTFLGLKEPVFFGLIGGIAVLLAVLGFLEARRSSRAVRRTILEG